MSLSYTDSAHQFEALPDHIWAGDPVDSYILTPDGVSIPADPRVVSPQIAQAMRSGAFGRAEAKVLNRIVRSDDRVLELGGGAGFISTLISRLGRTHSILTLEGDPGLISFIQRVTTLNGATDVETVNAVAVNGFNQSPRPFYLRADFAASSLSPEPNDYQRQVHVPVVEFDRLLEERDISLVICDIVGGEVDLFQDAELAGVERIFLRVHQRLIGWQGVKTIFDSLGARGFVYDYHCSAGDLILFRRLT